MALAGVARSIDLTESKPSAVSLSLEQANALREVGRRLRSQRAWWGEADNDEEDHERTVIRVEPRSNGDWSVTVANAVGVVAVDGVQFVIHPKIPIPHLLYLFSVAGTLPRLDWQQVALQTDDSLLDLIAEWFVAAAEILLRRGLVRDYQEREDALPMARGRIRALPTARLFYSGKLAVACEFDEFEFDTPINRVIRAAAQRVAGHEALGSRVRRRALGILARLEDVSVMRPGDLAVGLDRRAAHYADASMLARQLLLGDGRTLSVGDTRSWAFLLRTPDVVEDGIRKILQRTFGVERVEKRGMQLAGSSLTFNPDLVFASDAAVADVKYKVSGGQWSRPDLYQVTAFAEAYSARRAAIVRFRTGTYAPLAPLQVGTISVTELTWPSDPEVDPREAERQLADAIRQWLDGPEPAGQDSDDD